jgi:hypothetical protein
MKAEIKGIMTTEIVDFADFYPADSESFCVDIEIYIGLFNSDISNMFQFKIVTAKWLSENLSTDEGVFLRHMLLVKEWDKHKITNRFQKLVSGFDFESIEELAKEVSKFGLWEMEK